MPRMRSASCLAQASESLTPRNNEIRSGMMPVNDAYPVEVLMPAVRRYQETTGRRVSFESVSYTHLDVYKRQ